MNEYLQGEHDRRLANIVRVGTIAALDAANARVTVQLDTELVTDWLPWIVGRAGGNRTWHAPEIGEQVVVLAPSGEIGAGIVLPSIYQDAHPANSNTPDIHRTTYSDGSVVEYDRAAHILTVNVGSGQVVVNCSTAAVHASTSVTIDAPETTVTGHLTVEGGIGVSGGTGGTMQINGDVAITGSTLTHNGKKIGSTHKHSGVLSGGSQTGNPV